MPLGGHTTDETFWVFCGRLHFSVTSLPHKDVSKRNFYQMHFALPVDRSSLESVCNASIISEKVPWNRKGRVNIVRIRLESHSSTLPCWFTYNGRCEWLEVWSHWGFKLHFSDFTLTYCSKWKVSEFHTELTIIFQPRGCDFSHPTYTAKASKNPHPESLRWLFICYKPHQNGQIYAHIK